MKKKVTNLKQNKSQKVSKRTAHDINVDEKEIIQTNMISSDTDEIPQQTSYEPRAQNRVFTEKYSKAKQGVISSRLTNSNSHPTQGISSLEKPEENIDFSSFIETTYKEDKEDCNFNYRIKLGKYKGKKKVLLESLSSLKKASGMLKRIKLPEGNDRVNLTFALFGIHCAKLGITEVLGLTNEDANERNRLFTIVNLFEKDNTGVLKEHSNEKEKNVQGTANSVHSQNQNPKDSPSEENLNSDENPSSMHLEPNQENCMSDIFESESKEDIK